MTLSIQIFNKLAGRKELGSKDQRISPTPVTKEWRKFGTAQRKLREDLLLQEQGVSAKKVISQAKFFWEVTDEKESHETATVGQDDDNTEGKAWV